MAIVGMQENTLAQDEQLLADIRETQQQIRAHFCVNPGAAVGETTPGRRTSAQPIKRRWKR